MFENFTDFRRLHPALTLKGKVPSEAVMPLLIAAANAAHNARKASVFGVPVAELVIDGRAVMDRLRKERDAFVAAVLKSMDDIPVGIRVQQRARFSDQTSLVLGDGRMVSAKAVVVV